MAVDGKTLGFKIAAVTLSVLATLALLEVAARLFGPDYQRFNNNSALYFSNPRGYHTALGRIDGHTVYGIPYSATEDGFRLPEGTPPGTPLPDADYDILGLGDSFTFGKGVYHQDIYLTRVERMFRQAGRDVRIRNCGRVGGGQREMYLTYRRESREDGGYPVVVYGFVLNDFGLPEKYDIVGADLIDQNNGGYSYNPVRDHSALANLVGHALDTIRLHRTTIKAYQEAFRPEHAKTRFTLFDHTVKEIRADGRELVVLLFPLLYDFDDYPFHRAHAVVREFCENRDVPFLDLLPAYSRYEAEELWANPTDHHPNELAHEIAARELFAFLREQGLPPEQEDWAEGLAE
ncbi:MAG: SGNH/GDSL hydrolase family protein [Desulfatibacillaceae bacterium]